MTRDESITVWKLQQGRKKKKKSVFRNQLCFPALVSTWSGLRQAIHSQSSSSASVMKMVWFNRRQEHVAPETKLSENMLCVRGK